MRFQGQGFLVTGGGSGIGRATAVLAAAEGAHVGVTDVDLETAERTVEAIRAAGGSAHAFALDVREPKACTDVVAAAHRRLGRLDVLVNSAGVREISPVLDLAYEEWSRVIGINLTGTFLMSQAFARVLVAADTKGAIVNIASTLGVVAAQNRAAYVSSKHAVVGLTKEMAMELGTKGIRVNAVGPGLIRTGLTERYFQDAAMMENIKAIHALDRWGEADEVARAILFLASTEASFVTGTMLLVDGGWTAGKRM